MNARVWLCDGCVRHLFGDPVTMVAVSLSAPMPCGGCQAVVTSAAPVGADLVDRAAAALLAREEAKQNADAILRARGLR